MFIKTAEIAGYLNKGLEKEPSRRLWTQGRRCEKCSFFNSYMHKNGKNYKFGVTSNINESIFVHVPPFFTNRR